jgi:hypothetical protein
MLLHTFCLTFTGKTLYFISQQTVTGLIEYTSFNKLNKTYIYMAGTGSTPNT